MTTGARLTKRPRRVRLIGETAHEALTKGTAPRRVGAVAVPLPLLVPLLLLGPSSVELAPVAGQSVDHRGPSHKASTKGTANR